MDRGVAPMRPPLAVEVIGDDLAHEQHHGLEYNLTACGRPIVGVTNARTHTTCLECAARSKRALRSP